MQQGVETEDKQRGPGENKGPWGTEGLWGTVAKCLKECL